MDFFYYLNLVLAHKTEIIMGLTSLISFASLIAKYTPDTHDDEFVNSLIKFVNFLALNKTK